MGKGSTLREGFKRDFFAESASHTGSEILLFHQTGGHVIGRDFVESVLSKVGGSGASSSVPPKHPLLVRVLVLHNLSSPHLRLPFPLQSPGARWSLHLLRVFRRQIAIGLQFRVQLYLWRLWHPRSKGRWFLPPKHRTSQRILARPLYLAILGRGSLIPQVTWLFLSLVCPTKCPLKSCVVWRPKVCLWSLRAFRDNHLHPSHPSLLWKHHPHPSLLLHLWDDHNVLDCETPGAPTYNGIRTSVAIAWLNFFLLRVGTGSECVRTSVGGVGILSQRGQRSRGRQLKSWADRFWMGESGTPRCVVCTSPVINTNIQILQKFATLIWTIKWAC